MTSTLLFVCPHGAAKSVIAAALCQQFADARGIDLSARAAGTEPDPQVSPTAVALLRAEGIDVATTIPHQVTADDYPPISIRLQEQGTVAIRFTINADGSVTECQVATTSGKPRLDDAACTMVKRRWKYKPATQDGKPVAQAGTSANVVFQLK